MALAVAKSTFAANEELVMAAILLVLRSTESVEIPAFDTAKSGLPSPSTSPMAIDQEPVPVVKSTFAAKEVLLMEPGTAAFRNTDAVASLKFVTAISALPSPSRSPIASDTGEFPAVRSILARKEMLPLLEALRKMETEALPLFANAKSGLPSPSKSPMATK